MVSARMKGLFVTNQEEGRRQFDRVYGRESMAEIAKLIEIDPRVYTRDEVLGTPRHLQGVNILLCTWGAPRLDEEFLAAAADLNVVMYAAGSVRRLTTPAFWASDILISNAVHANAVPVAEYTFATMILSLKQFWRCASATRESRDFSTHHLAGPGAYRTPVGLVSTGAIGRQVAERLRSTDLRTLVYDPFLTEDEATALGVERTGLEDLFRTARVVSLHTPWLAETEGMITGGLVASMPRHATLINTARGAVIREDEMIEVLRERADLTAILDVSRPEPPRPDSPLYTLPNVILTPHISGSLDLERLRVGHLILDELRRFVAGEPLRYAVAREPEQRAAMA